jgi:hypothetical protein
MVIGRPNTRRRARPFSTAIDFSYPVADFPGV